MKKFLLAILSIFIFATLLTGCKQESTSITTTGNRSDFKVLKGQTVATIKVKDYGKIKVALFPDIAPKTVENFVTHAKGGYYNGLKFHRIIDNFMIQGGDPKGNGTGGESIWGKPFEDEFSPKARNFTGALCMANAGQPTTNTSQFYIINTPKITVPNELLDVFKKSGIETDTNYMEEYLDAYRTASQLPVIDYSKEDLIKYQEVGGVPELDDKHTVFGQVYEGLDVVKKIMTETETNDNDFALSDVIIEKITISKYKG